MYSQSFINSIMTYDLDGNGTFYTNGSSLFEDSSRIQIRIRPFVGEGDPIKKQVGQWSNAISYVDNIAPCDSDFVTAVNCDYSYRGGVNISEYVQWNNQGTEIVTAGYIQIAFPEDMDVNGPVPMVNLFYGTFNGDTPADSIQTGILNSGWTKADIYRCYLGIPVGDYTHGNDSTGVYFNVSVAGCRDIAGNTIQAYGTNGIKAKTVPSDPNCVNRKDADDQVHGSLSVIEGFKLCQN